MFSTKAPIVTMNAQSILHWLTFASALGSGLMAGVFFAFSVFIMHALARLPAAQGIAAMQSINITVINPWFLSVFSGTAAACLVLFLASLVSSSLSHPTLLIAASLLYLAGTILVTGKANIPRNNALAAAAPESAEAAKLWADYLITWTKWNHVRTITSLAASVLFIFALVL